MSLNAKGRTRRAKKAAKVAAKNRKAKTKQRDKDIYLAYRYLSKEPLSKSECYKAYDFLVATSGSHKLLPQQTVLNKLADATHLTRQRIHQIVKKAKNPL